MHDKSNIDYGCSKYILLSPSLRHFTFLFYTLSPPAVFCERRQAYELFKDKINRVSWVSHVAWKWQATLVSFGKANVDQGPGKIHHRTEDHIIEIKCFFSSKWRLVRKFKTSLDLQYSFLLVCRILKLEVENSLKENLILGDVCRRLEVLLLAYIY